MEPGRLDDRAVFSLRRKQPNKAGKTLTDEFYPYLAVWSNFRPLTGSEQAQQGTLVDVAQAVLRLRDTSDTRKITNESRVKVRNFDWAIKTVAPPDRRTGLIELTIERKATG